MTDEAIVEHLGRLIRASEVRVSAQTEALLALEGAGFDTVEAQAAMWREWEALSVLHRHELEIFATSDP